MPYTQCRRSEGFQVGDEVIVRAGESLELLGPEVGQFTVPAGTQGKIVEVNSSGARTIEWSGMQGQWALALQSLHKLQMLYAGQIIVEERLSPRVVEEVIVRDRSRDRVGVISPPRVISPPLQERRSPRVVEEVIVRDRSRDRVGVVSPPRVISPPLQERLSPRVVEEVIVRDRSRDRVGVISPPRVISPPLQDKISLRRGVCTQSGIASSFPQECTVIREVPRYKYVDKLVDVPRVEAQGRIVEVPQTLHLERVVEREIPETVERRREVAYPQYSETIKSVPRVSLSPSFREEAVRMTLREEFLEEDAIVNQVEMTREVAVFNEEVRRKEVVKKQFEFKERLEKVKAVTTKEEIYEVFKHQPFSLNVEMPRTGVVEKMERTWSKPVVEVQQRSEVLDVIQTEENIIETPEKIIIEIVKEVPKLVTEYIEKRISKPVYQYETVEQEVTYYVTEEEIVYVPEVRRIETIREVAVPIVQYADVVIPKHILDVREQTVEYIVPIKKQVGVYEDYVQDVTVVTHQPWIELEAKQKAVPKYILQAKEVLQDARCETHCERPKEFMEKACVDVVRELPKVLIENRTYEVKKDLFVPVQREVDVPIDLIEEVVELVPQVQTVEAVVEELIDERRQEIVALPIVQMEYVLDEVEVDWNVNNRDAVLNAVQDTVYRQRSHSPVQADTVCRQRSRSPVQATAYSTARKLDEKDGALWVARQVDEKEAADWVQKTVYRQRSPSPMRGAAYSTARKLDEKEAAVWVARQAAQETVYRQRSPSPVQARQADEKDAKPRSLSRPAFRNGRRVRA